MKATKKERKLKKTINNKSRTAECTETTSEDWKIKHEQKWKRSTESRDKNNRRTACKGREMKFYKRRCT